MTEAPLVYAEILSEAEATVRPGLRGRVWIRVSMQPGPDGAGAYTVDIPRAEAEAMADGIEGRLGGSGRVSLSIGSLKLVMGDEGAKAFAEGLRKALAWREGHP